MFHMKLERLPILRNLRETYIFLSILESVKPLPGVTYEDDVPAVIAAAASIGYKPDSIYYNDKALKEKASLKTQGVENGALLQGTIGQTSWTLVKKMELPK